MKLTVIEGGERSHVPLSSPYGLCMDAPSLILYKGEFSLRELGKSVPVAGEVRFELLPSPGVVFESFDLRGAAAASFENPTVVLPDGRTADARLTGIDQALSVDAPAKLHLLGSLNGPLRHEHPERLGRVIFHVINLRDLMGERLCFPRGSRTGRVEFAFGRWHVTLDSVRNLGHLLRDASARQSYAITHVGVLRRTDHALFGSDELESATDYVYWLLTLVNGARPGIMGLLGRRHEAILWEDWDASRTDPYTSAHSWTTKHAAKQCLTVAHRCYELWRQASARPWLTNVIAMYAEANKRHAGVELDVALAQVGLEMVAAAAGYSSGGAVDRIRAIVDGCKVQRAVPSRLAQLAAAYPSKDGPEAIVDIRNCVVHGTPANLAKLSSMAVMARYEAWQLAMWYMELGLLKLMDYKGPYDNRIGNPPGKMWDLVPWMTP